jgi:hypothetical protein
LNVRHDKELYTFQAMTSQTILAHLQKAVPLFHIDPEWLEDNLTRQRSMIVLVTSAAKLVSVP